MGDSTCSIDGCEKPVLCRGWCRAHYKLAMKYGDPLYRPSCAECGEKFDRTHPRQKFCTPECYRRKEWKRLGLMVDPLTILCANRECDDSFTQTRKYQKYCSQKCASRAGYVERAADPEWVEKKRTAGRAWADANRPMLRVKSRVWRGANKELHAEMSRAWRDNNRERSAFLVRRWSEANRDVRNEIERRRRARKRGSQVAVITPEMLSARAAIFGYKCWMCGGAFEAWDHVKPLAKGGPHILANLRPACRSCNSAKSAKWDGPRAA